MFGKVMAVIVVLATFLGTVWAQSECSESQIFCDSTCSLDVDCPPLSGCSVTNFTPACTGYYYVDAWTQCSEVNVNCDHCMACVQVSQGITLLTCRTPECANGTGDCCKTCGTVYLTANTTYQVKVCLSYCPNLDEDCGTCGTENCVACACLRYAIVAPCCIDE
jgi:hypothetical protein